MSIEIPVLGLLAERDMHGYDLHREIELAGLRRWMTASKVAVYKALERLERNGCLESRTDRAGNMPERVVYSVTDRGRERLRDLVYDLVASEEAISSPTCLSLYFIDHLPSHDALTAVEARIAFLEGQLMVMEGEVSMLEGVGTQLEALIRRHDIDRYQLEITWLQEVAECLRR